MPAMFKRWSGLAFVGPEAGRVWLSLCLPRVKMKEARLQGIHRVFCAFPRWFPRWSEDFSLFEKESKMRRGRWMIYELEDGGEEVIFLAREEMEEWMGGTLGVGVGNCWESRLLASSCYVIARHLFDLLIRIHLSLFFFFLSFKIVRDILEFFIIINLKLFKLVKIRLLVGRQNIFFRIDEYRISRSSHSVETATSSSRTNLMETHWTQVT